MRRFFFALGLFFLAASLALVAGLTFFVLRFDPNQYRPYLESTISERLKFRVELGGLSFAWRTGLALQVAGVSVRNQEGEIPFLETDSLYLRFDPWSLLRRQFVLYEFKLIRPNLLFIKKSDGTRNWEKVGEAPSSTSLPTGKGLGRWIRQAGGFSLLFSKVEMGEGRLHFRDETRSPPFEFELGGIQMDLEQTIPGGPLELRGKAASLNQAEAGLGWKSILNPLNRQLDFEIRFRKEEMILKGEAFPFQKPFRFRGTLEVTALDLEPLFERFKALREGRASLAGRAFGTLELEGSGSDPLELRRNLSGRGALEIREGAFRNVNVVDSILRRIALLPELSEVLVGTIPDPFQPVFHHRDTPFELLQTEFLIQGNQVLIQSLVLKSPAYLIEAQGLFGSQGEVNVRGKLILLEEMSGFLISNVNEFAPLQNPQGRIVIPFVYRGYWPSARPRPDLGYLAERLIVEQGARLLQKGLEALSQV